MLKIRDSVNAGTYQIATEDVADAIIAGPFMLSMSSQLSLGDRIVRLAEAPKQDDRA